MGVYNISFKDYLPDSAFRSIVVPSTNNNIQIVNFIKSKDTKPNFNTYNQKTTTFKSNSSKPKSYRQNSNKIIYNIDSLVFTNNNFNTFGLLENQIICLASDSTCNVCNDGSVEPNPCQLEVTFTPKIYPVLKYPEKIGINNEWIIEDLDANPINISNQTISFTVNSFEENPEFNINVYIKTKFCKEKTYEFSGTDSYSDTFNIPEFDEDDFVIEFLFIISSSDCSLAISYLDEDHDTVCTTTPTETIVPTYPIETTVTTYPTETIVPTYPIETIVPTYPIETTVPTYSTQLYCRECLDGRNTGEITEDYFTEQDAIDALNQGDADAAALIAFLDANGWCNAVITQSGFIEYIDDGVFQVWRVHYAVITAGCCGGYGATDPLFSTVTYGNESACLNDGTGVYCFPCSQQDCADNPCCVEVGPEPCSGP